MEVNECGKTIEPESRGANLVGSKVLGNMKKLRLDQEKNCETR